MSREGIDGNEAHRKAEWLAYQKHLAEVEELRALERAYQRAAQEVLVLRAELIDARLDRQCAELAWQALSLVRAVELVGSFRDELRTIIRVIADPLHIVGQIREKLKESPCDSIDWARFDAEFRSTYPEFQANLITRFPELTGVEIRVNVLLKLNLGSADIATLLCISQRSVEGHRLRISRKMGLGQDEDVHAILAGI